MVSDQHPLGELVSHSFHIHCLRELLWVLPETINPNQCFEDRKHLSSIAGLSLRVVYLHQRDPVLFEKAQNKPGHEEQAPLAER